MATKKAASPSKAGSKKKGGTKPPPASSNVVLGWEDDPLTMPNANPVERPVPDLASKRLAIRIEGTKPAPSIYPRGTPEFRFWATAEALRRSADYWADVLPATFRWAVGAQLPVHLDAGVDLNAFYSRGGADPAGLNFFHDTVNGVTYFSAESPEASCHELGHAVLDGLKPELWDVAFAEAAAFHESMGDMSAILSVLQLPSLRIGLISDTGGRLSRNSRISRIAEQLGFAIRQNHPDLTDPDSLRNAANSFFYRDPQELPPRAPSNLLSSEPHSFSRVFTAAFLDILAGIFSAQTAPLGEQQLLEATKIAGQLLVGAIQEAPVVPAYFSQVAANFLSVDAARFGKKYRDVIKGAFVRRGILSLDAASSGVTDARIASTTRALSLTSGRKGAERRLQPTAMAAQRFGLETLYVTAPSAPPRFAVAAAAPSVGEVEPPSLEVAAQSFVEDLFRLGRIEMYAHGDPDARTSQPGVRKTHELVATDNGVQLKRRSFDCGFDAGC